MTDQQRSPSAANAGRGHTGADPAHAQSKGSNKETTKQGHNGTYMPTGEMRGGIASNANADANTATERKEQGSIWERKAAKIGGHDGGRGSSFRDPKPLPAWLREP